MYIIWLIFMALVIGYLAVPLLREIGYSYGRFGRAQDLLVIVAGTLVFDVLIASIVSAVTGWSDNDTSRLILGFIGAVVTVVVITVLSAKAATDEDNLVGGNNNPDTSG